MKLSKLSRVNRKPLFFGHLCACACVCKIIENGSHLFGELMPYSYKLSRSTSPTLHVFLLCVCDFFRTGSHHKATFSGKQYTGAQYQVHEIYLYTDQDGYMTWVECSMYDLIGSIDVAFSKYVCSQPAIILFTDHSDHFSHLSSVRSTHHWKTPDEKHSINSALIFPHHNCY